MPITLTTAESRPDLNEVRLISFTANAEIRYAQAIYEVGYKENGEWRGERKVVVEWGENAERTFASLVNQVPQVRDLRNALETWAVGRALFSGSVS